MRVFAFNSNNNVYFEAVSLKYSDPDIALQFHEPEKRASRLTPFKNLCINNKHCEVLVSCSGRKLDNFMEVYVS